ncbi:MAG TPA: arginine--tRNA ligase [Bacteroidales bacterium]|nr:arginine--tRNA ligase [Bacteroidales bacterium]
MLDRILKEAFFEAYLALYGKEPDNKYIIFQATRQEFKGDFTIVVFPFAKELKKSPELLATELGAKLKEILPLVHDFNVIKGFLNLSISNDYWVNYLREQHSGAGFALNHQSSGKKIVVEYSSPNTNKPLHLGHIRNNLLGWSVAEILKANGHQVIKVNLVNDRGIHICKSMLAWQKWGKLTPEQAGMKGDKLVGEMYVRFDKEYKKEIETLCMQGMSEEEAARQAPLMLEAQDMLRRWEAGDEEVRRLWTLMNGWVYDGFNATYSRLGVDFEKIYYESDTYLLGKDMVAEGLEKGVFYRKNDGGVWCDLSDEGLDEKLLLRADGTSVYITQDLGTAEQRMQEYEADQMIYVVGNEQNYHFDVLRRLLKKLGKSWAENIEHLSYGMVELPEGKMKSREGTVVDADDLMEEMVETARRTTTELGKAEEQSPEDAAALYEMIGLGALKYFILKVDPKKTMLFNPAESIDFNGNTGPFIQYTHARIRSLLRKAESAKIALEMSEWSLNSLPEKERALIKMLHQYSGVVSQAGENRSPALVANYLYDLAKEFNQFYQTEPVLREEDETKRSLRITLSKLVADTLRHAGHLLGIGMPDKM